MYVQFDKNKQYALTDMTFAPNRKKYTKACTFQFSFKGGDTSANLF
jgi:hypothetical protein